MMEVENPQQKRMHASVEGLVQGVGFRAFVQQNAIWLNLTGWVRNRWDGSVEVVAEGELEQLEKMLAALKRGPRSASVRQVTVDWEDASGEFTSFGVRRTS